MRSQIHTGQSPISGTRELHPGKEKDLNPDHKNHPNPFCIIQNGKETSYYNKITHNQKSIKYISTYLSNPLSHHKMPYNANYKLNFIPYYNNNVHTTNIPNAMQSCAQPVVKEVL